MLGICNRAQPRGVDAPIIGRPVLGYMEMSAMNGTKLVALRLVKSDDVEVDGTVFHVNLFAQPGGGAIMAHAASKSGDRKWVVSSNTETAIDAKHYNVDIVGLLWAQVIEDVRNKVDLI